jgi:hypothetical protein
MTEVDNNEYPKEFYCPITYDLMRDPYIGPDGITYEYHAIVSWLIQSKTSPMTLKKMHMSQLSPNIALRSLIASQVVETDLPPKVDVPKIKSRPKRHVRPHEQRPNNGQIAVDNKQLIISVVSMYLYFMILSIILVIGLVKNEKFYITLSLIVFALNNSLGFWTTLESLVYINRGHIVRLLYKLNVDLFTYCNIVSKVIVITLFMISFMMCFVIASYLLYFIEGN